jgi:hypothetical protein
VDLGREGARTLNGVDEALEANLVVLEAADRPVTLLCIEALMAGPDVAKNLAHRAAQKGYPAQIFALATQTHSAPMLDRKDFGP